MAPKQIEVIHTGEAAALETDVDADLAEFNDWFKGIQDQQPLVRSEVAILKTYLWWKIRGEKNG